ncbi:MAG: tripartite tricarboxylate transporter substrate binding protein [Cytophagales bacterium]|nr:tripartite tricarboxylate transporter substrate binding protein [Cytophagales bacterium]
MLLKNSKTQKSFKTLTLIAAVWVGIFAQTAQAQAWPSKPVKIVVPFQAGGATDIVARVLATRLQEVWGQSVLVENKTGAGGSIGSNDVAKAKPDGFTLLMASGAIVINPHIYAKMSFDVSKDLVPITNVAQGPMVIVAAPQTPANNLKEFIALAKTKPMSFGSSGVGAQVHMAGENFLFAAGIEMSHIPYRGESLALADIAGGSVDMMAGNLAGMLPFIKSGKVKALGVTSAERSPAAPEIPTASEAGLPGFVNVGWFGLLAPAGTPKEVIDRVHADTVRALATDEVKQRLLALGMVGIGNTPAQFGDAMRREGEHWARVVKARKIQSQ